MHAKSRNVEHEDYQNGVDESIEKHMQITVGSRFENIQILLHFLVVILSTNIMIMKLRLGAIKIFGTALSK